MSTSAMYKMVADSLDPERRVEVSTVSVTDNAETGHVASMLGPEGVLTVQPYLHLRNAHTMIPFIEAALGAKATGVHKSPDDIVHHATIELANATLEIDEASRESQPNPSYLRAYVPDADALYARAVAAGAKGMKPSYTAPYGDRAATITDPFGNTWFLATYLGTTQP